MSSHQGLHIARVLILLGLMGFFIFALGTTMMNKHRRTTFTTPVHDHVPGIDPGIRVLLTDRANHKKYHRRMDILILQASVLLCPGSEHKDLKITLDPQEILTIQSSLDGIKISCKEIDKTWNVKQVLLQSALTSATAADGTTNRLQAARFEARDRKAVFSVNRNRYRGNLEIIHTASQQLTAINCLPIESYLEGVIPSEMPYFYPEEALFAQAIASRSYAYANKLQGQNASTVKIYDVVDTVESQEYLGTSKEKPNTTHAVRKTSGLILTYNGHCFPSYFNACSGGMTASVRECFPNSRSSDGRTVIDAVMISKLDPYCLEGIDALERRGLYWKHETIIKSSELKKSIGAWLKKKNKNVRVGYVQDIRIRDPLPGRVSHVEVITNQDGVDFTFTGMQFRNEIIGPRKLRSLYWGTDSLDSNTGKLKFNNKNATYSITTFGLGHGVGMSQVSAYAMAKIHRKTAHQILSFFYEKTELRKEW